LQYALEFSPERMRPTELKLTPGKIAEFVDWLCQKTSSSQRNSGKALSDETIRRIVAPERACLGTAACEGLVGSNPASGVALSSRTEC
jgi:hypothetical protein